MTAKDPSLYCLLVSAKGWAHTKHDDALTPWPCFGDVRLGKTAMSEYLAQTWRETSLDFLFQGVYSVQDFTKFYIFSGHIFSYSLRWV